MARYSQYRRRPRRGGRRRRPVARSYSQIGLGYLKSLGKALAYGGAAAGVAAGAAAAYKYRGKVAPAAAAARDRAMRTYDAAETGVAGRAAQAQSYVRGLYDRARNAWDGYRAVPNYGAQFRDAARQVQRQGYGGRQDSMNDYEYMYRQAVDADAARAARNRFFGNAPPLPLVPY